MRKNDITQYIPNYPSDKEGAAAGDPAQKDKDYDVVKPSNGQWLYTCTFPFFSIVLSGYDLVMNNFGF